ncbi:MAG: hypothetical protein AB8B64_15085 [Granulosicoccus sp.]
MDKAAEKRLLEAANCQFGSRSSHLIIGLSLVLVYLVSIPITNTSVNPACSTSQAIFANVL